MPDLAHYENLRETLVEQEYARLLNEALTDITAFETWDADYEICLVNSGQIQRALRNLDDAIKGKEYAQDAVFTALNYVLASVKTVVREQAESSAKSAEEMMFEGKQ